MHEVAAEENLKHCQRRHDQGDCPFESAAGVETLEFALIEMASQRDASRRQLPLLASAIHKLSPELAQTLALLLQALISQQAASSTEREQS